MKLPLGDLIFGVADFISEYFPDKVLSEVEKSLKRVILFFAGIVLVLVGIFFIAFAIFEYLKFNKIVAYLADGIFLFLISLIFFLVQKSIK